MGHPRAGRTEFALDQLGVGSDVAAKLLIAAGDNPQRIGTEAGFAALCGVNPIAASSGKTSRHRLNRSGDRQANSALWTIARVRLTRDPATVAYAKRRTEEGLSHREHRKTLHGRTRAATALHLDTLTEPQ